MDPSRTPPPQVVRAPETEHPEHRQEAAADEPAAGPSGAGFAGLVWTAVVAAAWLVLAGWQPSTTWHLAPLLVAAAGPWVVGQDQSPDDPSARRRIVVAAVAGLAVASLATGALATTDHLEGPTWTGSGSTVAEALLLAGAGSLLAMVAGLARTVRRADRD